MSYTLLSYFYYNVAKIYRVETGLWTLYSFYWSNTQIKTNHCGKNNTWISITVVKTTRQNPLGETGLNNLFFWFCISARFHSLFCGSTCLEPYASIPLRSSTYPGTGQGGTRLNRVLQTSLSLATLSSSQREMVSKSLNLYNTFLP